MKTIVKLLLCLVIAGFLYVNVHFVPEPKKDPPAAENAEDVTVSIFPDNYDWHFPNDRCYFQEAKPKKNISI